jgi:hypothetical protein
MWDGLDTRTRCVVDGQYNHFTVIEALRDPDSEIVSNLVD